MLFHALESRSYYAGITLTADGVLSVIGNDDDNQIVISGVEVVTVRVDDTSRKYQRSHILSADIAGMGGQDRIDNDSNIPAFITGGAGDDTMIGGTAYDRFDPGPGTNEVRGRSDAYALDYSRSATGIARNLIENLINGQTGWYIAGEQSIDIFAPPQSLTIELSEFADYFYGLAASQYPGEEFTVFGRGADDHLSAPQFDFGAVTRTTLNGGDGDDIFHELGLSVRAIDGGNGDDFLDDRSFVSADAAVRIDLGPGYDTHDCSAENFSGDGTEVFRVGAGVEAFFGPSGIGNYTLIGNELDNFLTAAVIETVTVLGMGGNDYIEAMPQSLEARASLDGGEGNDEFLSGFPFSTIVGGAGNDTVTSNGQDSIDGGEGNDRLTSPTGGPDTLLGGAGNDLIYAADGNRDTIDGGPGRDYAQFDAPGRGAVGDVISNVEKLDARPVRVVDLRSPFAERRIAAEVLH